jgi:ectoine hydroxylase-related dioxygenase (phytanoyl-CoA dioxygenase family)
MATVIDLTLPSSDPAVRTSTQPLSATEVKRFNDDGFLVKNFGFSTELIDSVIEDVYPHYSEQFRANPVAPERIRNGWKQLPNVKTLAIAPQVLDALEQLWGRKALAFQTLNFPIGTSQKIHSDIIHFNTEPSGFMAGVWIALEDIDESNGPLIYYPGSHKMPELTMADLKLQAGREHYAEYEVAIDNLVKENGLKPSLGTVKKGDAIIWHSNLLHGGFPHQDVKRSRHSQVTHYFFENCRYYTPMLYNKNDKKVFDHPEWVNQMPISFMQRVKNKIARTMGVNKAT